MILKQSFIFLFLVFLSTVAKTDTVNFFNVRGFAFYTNYLGQDSTKATVFFFEPNYNFAMIDATGNNVGNYSNNQRGAICSGYWTRTSYVDEYVPGKYKFWYTIYGKKYGGLELDLKPGNIYFINVLHLRQDDMRLLDNDELVRMMKKKYFQKELRKHKIVFSNFRNTEGVLK